MFLQARKGGVLDLKKIEFDEPLFERNLGTLGAVAPHNLYFHREGATKGYVVYKTMDHH